MAERRAARLLAILALLLAVAVIVALGWVRPGDRLLLPLTGAVLLAAGLVLGRLRWRDAMGIRTPWTLASQPVWEQTHRFGARLLVACGILLGCAEALRTPDRDPAQMAAIALVASVVAILAKSYVYWLKQRHLEG